MVWCFSLYGQGTPTIKVDTATSKIYINDICQEYGHVCISAAIRRVLSCPTYIIDTGNKIVQVYPTCNLIIYTCGRCGKKIEQYGSVQEITLWQERYYIYVKQ